MSPRLAWLAWLALVPAGTSAGERPDWRLDVATGFLRMDYTEHDIRQQTRVGYLDTENGQLPLLRLALSGRGQWHDRPVFVEAALDNAWGQTDYNGHYQLSLQPLRQLTGNHLLDGRLRVGASWAGTGRLIWSPFVELGGRQWQRDLVTYAEDYRHLLLAAGLGVEWRAASRWQLAGALTAGRILLPRLYVQGVTLDIGEREAWSAEVAAGYALAPRLSLRAGVHYQYFAYGESTRAPLGRTLIYEPDSASKLTRWLIGLERRF